MELNLNYNNRVAVFNDLSALGRCSLSVAMPILSAYSLECVPILSALLSTHTGGFTNVRKFVLDQQMKQIIAHYKELGLKFGAIYSGYLCNKEQIETVKQFIADFADVNTLILVDPVMADCGKFYDGFNADFAKEMLTLCRMADVITPNITEARLLCGEDLPPKALAQKIGCPATVITGIEKGKKNGYYITDDITEKELYYCHRHGVTHGCGDVFASLLCGELLKKQDIFSAAGRSAALTNIAVKKTAKLGVNAYGLNFESIIKKI